MSDGPTYVICFLKSKTKSFLTVWPGDSKYGWEYNRVNEAPGNKDVCSNKFCHQRMHLGRKIGFNLRRQGWGVRLEFEGG